MPKQQNIKYKKYFYPFRIITACVILLIMSAELYSRTIWVSLYNNLQVRGVVVSAYNGALTVFADGEAQFTVAYGQAFFVQMREGKIWVNDMHGETGAFEQLIIEGADSSTIVRLRPIFPQAEARNYEALVSLSVDIDRIQMVNRIDEDRYLAGVMEAEAGQGRTPEFYKAKAIICRTYLYGHIDRHENEGFHLCDEVHCQAYKGQCRSRNQILPAVIETRNIVLTDRKESKPILAAYHSNCGGETESARNIWRRNMPYLVPVTDPYCTTSLNARWQKTIPLDDWIGYLVKNGFKYNPNVATDFSFRQARRVTDYKVNRFSLPVRNIRNDWQLRSTFFSVSVSGNQVVLSGRGYGHGAGLCQEGAIEMGRRGFKYGDIISFYYKNVNMSTINTLKIRIPEFESSIKH